MKLHGPAVDGSFTIWQVIDGEDVIAVFRSEILARGYIRLRGRKCERV